MFDSGCLGGVDSVFVVFESLFTDGGVGDQQQCGGAGIGGNEGGRFGNVAVADFDSGLTGTVKKRPFDTIARDAEGRWREEILIEDCG